MRDLQNTISAGHNRSRIAVCLLLIPLLLLSGISLDVFVTHVHDDGLLHTHMTRKLSTQDLHQHHDSHHDHDHPPLPCSRGGQSEAPAGPCTECESTIVVSSSKNLIRQNRETAMSVLVLLPAAILIEPASTQDLSSVPHVRSDSGNERLTSAQVLRSTVLLI